MRHLHTDSRFMSFVKKKRLLKFAKNNSGFKLSSTKYGEPVLICLNRVEGDLLLLDMFYTDGIGIYSSYLKGLFEKDVLLIGDIGVLEGKGYSSKGKPPYGRGYGTILMAEAIDECFNRGISKIYGKRVYSSREQNERQMNYYKRHGFDVDPQGRIYLELGTRYHLVPSLDNKSYEAVSK